MSKLPITITILGCGSASPTKDIDAGSSQVLQADGQVYLIDCCEGVQNYMIKAGIGPTKINRIFISHMHGDHAFGLVPLISYMDLVGRKEELHIYGPEQLKTWIDVSIKCFYGQDKLGFPINFHPLKHETALLYQGHHLEIWSIQMAHSIPANGFLFKEYGLLPHANMEAIMKYGISLSQIKQIKRGKPGITESGEEIPNELLVLPPDEPKSYAYCSDTGYCPEIIKMCTGVTAMYHEASFQEKDKNKALMYGHSTASMAGKVAKEAGVEKLYIGHISARSNNHDILAEVMNEFEKTSIVRPGHVITL